MRLAIAVVTLALLPSLVDLAPAAAQERDERQGISWPSRDFPTLQSAVDALSDGGTLRIAAGVFRLEQPLMIEGKRLIIEGAGCHPARPGRGAGQLAASSTGTFTNNQIVQSERAGLSSFGSTLSLSGNTILCSAFDIDVEELNGTPGVVQDLGGNQCGCGQTGQCVAASSSLQAPTPIGGLE